MTTTTPPYISVTWTATALGIAFGGYNIYRRPSRAVAVSWTLIGSITVPTGFTAATVETQHISFNDYEAGWTLANGQWTDGFDYAVSVINATTTLESALSTVSAQVQQTADTNPWIVSNVAPYYNFPIASLQRLDATDDPFRSDYRIAARDLAVTRTRLELPPRTWLLAMRVFSRLGEDQARVWRAAAASGLPFAIHAPYGDRLIGVLEAPDGIPHEDVGVWTLSGQALEVDRNLSGKADYNLPAGLVLASASSQYATVANNALLNPSGAFTVAYYGTVGNSAGNRYALTKGNAPGGVGYYLGTTGNANEFSFSFKGATTNGAVTDTSATWFDGVRHSAIATSSGTAQVFYRDGVQVQTGAVTHGAITNTGLLAIGANNVSVTPANFMDCTAQAWLFYNRALTATEAANLHKYLTGVPGYRPPAGAAIFVDLRDNRSWDGTQSTATILDLSGNALNGTIVASPKTKGIPWNLANLDVF